MTAFTKGLLCGLIVLRVATDAVLPCLISLDAVDRAVCGVEFGSASMPSASSARGDQLVGVHARSA
jgi:hypothetical protein